MPIFEYRCRACRHTFEALVRGGTVPPCPSCQGADLEKLPSLFAVDSDGTRATARERSMPKAIGRQRDKEIADIETYERHHH
ncbi:MAG: zinc ribbon domain-containing protein [Vicinamibacterales bacterium]